LNRIRRSWQRWQAAAGAWKGWSVCPALLAPEAAAIPPRAMDRPEADDVVAGLTRTMQAGGTALILDLEPILGISVAARLNQLGLANAVLVLPRWPYQQAILPVDGLLYALTNQARRLRSGNLTNVAFVLDAERTRAVPGRPRQDERVDNRYRLTAADLPNLAAIRTRGISNVVKLSQA
jgi:hypothetical protein